MAKWQIAFVAAFVVIFGITVILTGSPSYLIAAVMIAVLVLAWAGFNRVMTKRVESRHDSIEDAMSDESEPLPSAHLIPDNETAAPPPGPPTPRNSEAPAADPRGPHDKTTPPAPPPAPRGGRAAEDQAAE